MAKLPDYMVPAAYVRLDALPLTPNGKLDRKALPAPDASAGGWRIVAPRNETEQSSPPSRRRPELDQVSLHANFFDLGGHSLLATQLVSRIRQQFNVELPLRALFEAPTSPTWQNNSGRRSSPG